jgi:hypothetical protein
MQGLPKRPATGVRASCIPFRLIQRTKLALNQCATLASSPRKRVTSPTHDHACHDFRHCVHCHRGDSHRGKQPSYQIGSHGAGHSACIKSLAMLSEMAYHGISQQATGTVPGGLDTRSPGRYRDIAVVIVVVAKTVTTGTSRTPATGTISTIPQGLQTFLTAVVYCLLYRPS